MTGLYYGSTELDNQWTFGPPDMRLERQSAPHQVFHCDSNAPSSHSRKGHEHMEDLLVHYAGYSNKVDFLLLLLLFDLVFSECNLLRMSEAKCRSI